MLFFYINLTDRSSNGRLCADQRGTSHDPRGLVVKTAEQPMKGGTT